MLVLLATGAAAVVVVAVVNSLASGDASITDNYCYSSYSIQYYY